MFPDPASRPARDPLQPIEIIVLLALPAFSLLLFAIGHFGDPALTKTLTSEYGLFEVLSPPLWILLGILCLTHLGRRHRHGIGAACLSLVFAAREWDLHKAFTADSIFKNAFYRMDVPVTQKIAGGIAAILCIGLLLWILAAGVRYLYRSRAWRYAWGRMTILAIGMIFATKILDRLPATLSVDYGIELSRMAVELCHMHEEGFEMLLPVLFGLGLILWRRAADRQRR